MVETRGESFPRSCSANGATIGRIGPDVKGAQQASHQGVWDSSGAWHDSTQLLTLSCTGGAIAKCTTWGYKPWKDVDGVRLRDYHQACTRMVRADYCGDGTPHTRNGTPIDLWDRLPVQVMDPADGMTFEAAWAPSGATYVARERLVSGFPDVVRECGSAFRQEGRHALVRRDAPTALVYNRSFTP